MTIELTLSTSLLIAHPQLEGEFFARSVIYLVSHNDEGSFGFIINKLVNDETKTALVIVTNKVNHRPSKEFSFELRVRDQEGG